MSNRRLLSAALRVMSALPLMAPLLVGGGCQLQERYEAAPEKTGTIDLALVSAGASGTTYRLRHAVMYIQGPSSTLFLDTEDVPKDDGVIHATVPVGEYEGFIQEGWYLESEDDGPVDALMLSDNPFIFHVTEGETTPVTLEFRVGGVDVGPQGSFEIQLGVEEEPAQTTICADDSECGAGETCCIAGFLGTCIELEGDQECPLPDLTIDAAEVARTLNLGFETFASNSCAIAEGCVDGSGSRRLLRFSTETPNVGDADLILGVPGETPDFVYAPCHNHYHFEGYAEYELIDDNGVVEAIGHKQSFCLLDSNRAAAGDTPQTPRYHCGFQGIQRGWADAYTSNLDCQWVDVTDVEPGNYTLRVIVNATRALPESNYDNNMVEVPVVIDPVVEANPVEPCDARSLGRYRECGWQLATGHVGASCTPGSTMRASCGCDGLGTYCSGDAMMRVCPGDEACPSTAVIGSGDDACGLCPSVTFPCPEQGEYTVLVGAYDSIQPYSCEVGAAAL